MTLLDYAYDLFKGVKQKEYSFTHEYNKLLDRLSKMDFDILII